MVDEVPPGTTAAAASTTPFTTPAPPIGSIVASTQGVTVAQTSLTTSLGGCVVSTLTTQLQLQTFQSALQSVQGSGSLLSPPAFEVQQVPIFSPGMAVPFNMNSLAGSLPGVSLPPGLDVDPLASIVGKMALEHATLLKSKRESDIDIEVGLYSNPLSKRSVEHDMRLSDIVENIVRAMVYGNTVVQATPTNCDQIDQIFALIMSSVQELRHRIASDRSKHLIGKTSSLGWKFVSSLELLEGKVGRGTSAWCSSGARRRRSLRKNLPSVPWLGPVLDLQLVPVEGVVVVEVLGDTNSAVPGRLLG
jgi:hypothetical protein